MNIPPVVGSRAWFWRILACLALGAVLGLAGGRPAAAEDGLLPRLRESGRLHLGGDEDSMPLSYGDGRGQLLGYQIDICLRIVDAIRRQWDLPALRVVPVPTTAASRVALLGNGSIDMSCGANPVSNANLGLGLLSHATAVLELGLLTRADRAELQLAQIGGQRVVVMSGSPALGRLRGFLRNSQLSVVEVPARTTDAMRSLLDEGRGDVLLLPDAQLLALTEAVDRSEQETT